MKRAGSIDLLRGMAVLMMTFSGNLPLGDLLPAWMYHAQEPPPMHEFDPTVAGITWVDVVFPFFLFCMGAVIPFVVPAKLNQEGLRLTLLQSVYRFIKMLLFAIVVWSFHPWRCTQLGWGAPWVGLLTYIGFFAAFVKPPNRSKEDAFKINMVGYIILAFAMFVLVYNGKYIHPSVNDPIIRLLANTYLVGIALWIASRHSWSVRVGFGLVVMSLYLGGKVNGSWVQEIYEWSSPFMMFQVSALQYLLVFIPGSIAGDILSKGGFEQQGVRRAIISGLATMTITISTLVGLLFRQDYAIEMSFLINFGVLIGVFLLTRSNINQSERQILALGAILLLAGYLVEPFQEGIKKDNATLSYFLITSGLATFWIWTFESQPIEWRRIRILRAISLTGQNSLMAYAMAGFLVIPIMDITRMGDLFSWGNPLKSVSGVVEGLFITSAVGCLTAYFSKRKIFWKI